jgi:solute carrier family 25 oxoglutarate transporter 11
MGLYSTLTLYMKGLSTLPLSFPAKVSCAAAAGAISSLLSTPLDLALTRVQANNALPVASRIPNLNPVKVLTSAWAEGGVQGLFRGASPTVLRAVLLNIGMLSVGDELKQRFTSFMDPTPALLLSSVVAGVVCALLSLPADLLKTRIQSGLGEDKGMRHIAMEVLRKEGLGAFWKGSIPYVFRIAPHGVITLVLTPYFLSLLR